MYMNIQFYTWTHIKVCTSRKAKSYISIQFCIFNFRVFFGSEWLSDLWTSVVVPTFTSNWISDVCVGFFFFRCLWVGVFIFFLWFFKLLFFVFDCFVLLSNLFVIWCCSFWMCLRSCLGDIYSVSLCCLHVFVVELTLGPRDLSFVDSPLYALMSSGRFVTFAFFFEKGIQIHNTTYNMELLCIRRFANIP